MPAPADICDPCAGSAGASAARADCSISSALCSDVYAAAGLAGSTQVQPDMRLPTLVRSAQHLAYTLTTDQISRISAVQRTVGVLGELEFVAGDHAPQLGLVLLPEGRHPAQHLVQQDAHRPPVHRLRLDWRLLTQGLGNHSLKQACSLDQ